MANPPDPRYPIGKFELPEQITDLHRKQWIDEIAAAPAGLRAAVKGLSVQQLDTPYREGGWSVRQVVHHVPESHLNAYVRTKLAITESNPTVKPYDENAWAVTPEVRLTPIDISLTLLEAVHARWVLLLRALQPADFAKTFFHPERNAKLSLNWLCGLYAWHGKHHTAHITTLRSRMKW